MVLQQTVIILKPGHAEAFEAAFASARKLAEAASGFQGLEIRRCIEDPNRYLLLARWDRVEDHLDGFRNSPAFQEWRALLGPHFDGMPATQHFMDFKPQA